MNLDIDFKRTKFVESNHNEIPSPPLLHAFPVVLPIAGFPREFSWSFHTFHIGSSASELSNVIT